MPRVTPPALLALIPFPRDAYALLSRSWHIPHDVVHLSRAPQTTKTCTNSQRPW